MNKGEILLVFAIICDWLLIGIFSYEFKKTKDKNIIFLVLGMVFVFFVCLYYLLQKLGVVIVL